LEEKNKKNKRTEILDIDVLTRYPPKPSTSVIPLSIVSSLHRFHVYQFS